MKRMMLNLAGIMVLVGFMSIAAVSAKAENLASYVSDNVIETNVLPNPGDQDFVLINSTGTEIYSVYITRHSAKTWGEDVLGVDTLPSGESTTIVFAPGQRGTYWDIRVEDEEGNYIEWYKFNLKVISTIELFYKNGKATAVYN